IELHNIYENKTETLTTSHTMYDLKKLFLTTNQPFVVIVNDNKIIDGIIYLKDVQQIFANQYKLSVSTIESLMQPALSASLSENTGNVIEMMDKNKINVVLMTQDNKLVGYVTKLKILEVYRENLKNLRIE